MKISLSTRISISLFLIISMLSPMTVLAAGDGKKHFKEGMRQESAEQWDKAAEEFALAVTENPKNPEFRLHLTRSLFNASQMYMRRGTAAAKEGDYEGGYNAFRKAYGFDPTNELAQAEMERMIRLQKGPDADKPDGKKDVNGQVKLVQTGYNTKQTPDPQIPQRIEKLRDVTFPAGVDLQFLVKDLAKDLDLNVLFDAESRFDGRKVKIEVKGVSPAKALDYIFLQENLFFQRVGPRTILVATGLRRTNFQQLVLRTFYLANANPKDVQTIIQSAIPAQPGRTQTIVLKDDATNSITIRDTTENIRLISKLISSLDKDRAEVVMDVAIYEVNKSDLLQFGNQIGVASGTGANLTNLGGGGLPIFQAGQPGPIGAGLPFSGLSAASFALGLPLSSITALQTKNNTKLIASTQIHAFNNEDSSARIGQRVPVRSASFAPVGTTTPGTTNNFVGDVINYEQVGLTLKFKPIIFPNQDVQVAMEIESKDVAGASSLTPIFTERTIKGTARIQNNKTLLLASVAQNNESNGRSGLPLIGLIPILGRLFTAPTRDNQQLDIVIAVTPRVIRAPSILPEDEVERDSGSLASPTNGSLDAMVAEEDRQEYLAAARRVPNAAEVQLPDQKLDAPTYVRTGTAPSDTSDAKVATANSGTETQSPQILPSSLRPIDSSVKTLQINRTADTSPQNSVEPKPIPMSPDTAAPETAKAAQTVELYLPVNMPAMKAGEKTKIAIPVSSTAGFRSAMLGLKFDESKLAVRSVSFGDVFGPALANTSATPFLNEKGKMYVSLSMPQGVAPNQTGVLAFVEIEALVDGTPALEFARDVLNFLTSDGKNFTVKF